MKKKIPSIVELVIQILDVELTTRHFGENQLQDPSDEYNYVEWERDSGWRLDKLILTWGKKSEEIVLNLETELKLNGETISMDGTTLDYLVGKTAPAYRFPSKILGSFGQKKFLATIQKDVAQGIKWFDFFADPSLAKVRLESGAANFARKGSSLYNSVLQQLGKLAQSTAREPRK